MWKIFIYLTSSYLYRLCYLVVLKEKGQFVMKIRVLSYVARRTCLINDWTFLSLKKILTPDPRACDTQIIQRGFKVMPFYKKIKIK